MSLLQDAIKAKQRERAELAQPESNPQIPVEGFFPYVGSPARKPGKRRQMVAVGAAGVALLAVVTWLAWPNTGKAPAAAIRPPIILPPPVTVSKTPAVVESTKAIAADGRTAAPERAPLLDGATGSGPAVSSSQSKEPQSAVREQPAAPSPGSSNRVERPAPAATEPVRIRPVTVDYEAQATILFNAGDFAGARDEFERATRVAPSARVWTNYGVTLQRLGDLSGAVAAYRSAVGIDPNYVEAWLYQGRVAAEQGELGRAVPLLQRALTINPLNADANVELARLEYDSHNWTEARRFAEAALRGDATNIRAYWYLAVASDPLKDADAAIRGYTGYLKYVGDTPDQTVFIGWARTRLAELGRKP